MPAKKNEGGDIPAHNEHPNSDTYNCRSQCTDITEVFGPEKQGIRPEGFHKGSIHRAEQNKPEYQQCLVFPEMQEQQLYGKGIIKSSDPYFHQSG
jgi:hypothetical protein